MAPTVQGTDDFNHSITAGFYDAFFNSPAGLSSVSSPLYGSQPATLSLVTTGSTLGVRKNITGSPTLGWAAFPYRVNTTPGGDVVIFAIQSAGGTNARIYMNSSRVLKAYVNGVDIVTGPTIAVDTWYWIEAILDVSGTTHSLYWQVAGSSQTTSDRTGVSADTISYNQLLDYSGASGVTSYYGLWKWGVPGSTSDWLGESGFTVVTNDFVMPWLVDGVDVSTALGSLSNTQEVSRVFSTQGRAPLATDDAGQGFAVGDIWIYALQAWISTSVADDAAVWDRIV